MTKFIGIIYGNSKAAYNLWRRTIDQSIIGFSAVRWYCQVEIEMQIAAVFPCLRPFLVKLVDDDLCPTLGPAALAIYDRDPLQLKVEFAATVDVKMLVEACYNLEADGLVVLMAYGVLSSLIAFGHRLQHPGYLPTAEAVLRASAVLSKGTVIRKVWAGHGVCTGKIVGMDTAESSLYPGQDVTVYTVRHRRHHGGPRGERDPPPPRRLLGW